MSDPNRWWREALALWRRPAVGRAFTGAALLGGAVGGGGCGGDTWVRPDPSPLLQREDDVDVTLRSVELQQREGWDVGAEGQETIAWRGASPVDIDGSVRWQQTMEQLTQAMAPRQPELWPWYVPTLLQSLSGPDGERLRSVMTPVRTHEMDVAFQKGLSLASLFAEQGWPTDTALVVDLPGPESVAFAAALAPRFDPVLDFDNWPHPEGIVPSHETLGALLFFQPLLDRARAARTLPAAPAFVLDADRLRPYSDAADRFDNRYLARLPSPEALQRLGVRHVLYINAKEGAELDDLNDTLSADTAFGVDVKTLALSDFTPITDGPSEGEALASGDGDGDGYDDALGWDDTPLAYFYGGSLFYHRGFWGYYGWYRPRHQTQFARPAVMRTSHGFARVIAPRATLLGATRATVGHVAVQIARSSGHVVGLGSGAGRGVGMRSGSFGRASGFSSG